MIGPVREDAESVLVEEVLQLHSNTHSLTVSEGQLFAF